MKITYVERNGKQYAYSCTSTRVPGKKNPISKMTYLGTYDPKTGLISPKKIRPEALEDSVHDGSFTSLDYGSVILCYSIAEKLGVVDAIKTTFGEDFGTILALSIAYAANPSSSSDPFDAVQGFYFLPFTNTVSVSKTEMRRISKIIGERMWKYYLELGCKKKSFLFECTDFNRELESTSNVEGLNLNYYPTFFIVNSEGRFIINGSATGLQDPDSAIGYVLDRGKELSERISVVLPWDSRRKSIIKLIMNNRDMVVPINPSLPVFRSMYSADAFEDSYGIQECIFDGHMYQVISSVVGLISSGGGWILIDKKDSRFDDRNYTLNVYIWRDETEGLNVLDTVRKFFKLRCEEMKNMTQRQIEDVINPNSWESQFVDFSKDAYGEYNCSIKTEQTRYISSNAGLHAFITTTCSWYECMSAIKLYNRLNKYMRSLTDLYSGHSRYKISFDSRYMQYFIRCISIDIRMEIERVLDIKESEMTADDVFRIASSYRTVISGETTYISSMSRKTKMLFDLFDVYTVSTLSND